MSDVVKLFKNDEFRRAQEDVAKQWDQMMEYREKRKKEYEAAKAKTKEQLAMTNDLVNHPAHYEEQSIRLEPIDFCERLPFCEGNAIKYCFRAGHKDGASELLDLKKAQWYLNRRRTSNTALKMSDKQFDTFKEFTWYLKRSNGVLKAAADLWGGVFYYNGGFWQALEDCINERIQKLEVEEALYDQTIGDKK